MRNIHKAGFAVLFLLGGALAAFLVLRGSDIAVLNPSGAVGLEERQLMLFAALLAIVVVVPVFIMLFTFAWKYRESNTSAKYTPDADRNPVLETAWWGIPGLIILVLSIVTWISTHALDPYKSLEAKAEPIKIQVVALDWKWLFIYPEQNIATVNYAQFPKHTPLEFHLTSDTVMSSFWIPKLGGQIYAMPGMSTKLHLIAQETGSYHGLSANINGKGFAGMNFAAKASSQQDFMDWVAEMKQSEAPLTIDAYKKLAQPSQNHPVTHFSSVRAGLYDWIVMKYMVPSHHAPETNRNHAMHVEMP